MVDKSMSHAKGTSSKYHPMEHVERMDDPFRVGGVRDVQSDYVITNNLDISSKTKQLGYESYLLAPSC
jgi:hypothetical protein